MSPPISALIADDEPLLRADLADELARLWPELQIVAQAEDGPAALAACRAAKPQIAFLDIRMPGMSGMDVARALLAEGTAPLMVFVTAYDSFAIEAFEREAVDYLLKPVTEARLAQCIGKLKKRLEAPAATPDISALLAALQGSLAGQAAPARLNWIRAAVGDTVKMIPVSEVIYFAATDKYIAVFTREGESLIRTPLKELLDQLDPVHFQQIHRGMIVNLRHVQNARSDGNGRVLLRLAGRPETLTVSRSYAHLFRQM
ncbi:LytTR family DNA-binding domain-containing protein [Niveibacterium sp. 24ML]|uniref:LytR/AlgR family response regulator transcription factor n=1 Tax=Niveibacterium sp. 24ML TaxID=2985512 RepID=UPI00226E2198|nr:LytTR family DNA-binding domain-containing protein [Niveibacterium sp. 24ML]MCX9154801.1 LytTR family DNA-binding domain-containing protein [Niveibacterium sp. 24ML]